MSTLEAIKRAILADKRSRYAIAQASGIAESGLSRLIHGKIILKVDTLDKLAKTLGLEVTLTPLGSSRKPTIGGKVQRTTPKARTQPRPTKRKG